MKQFANPITGSNSPTVCEAFCEQTTADISFHNADDKLFVCCSYIILLSLRYHRHKVKFNKLWFHNDLVDNKYGYKYLNT